MCNILNVLTKIGSNKTKSSFWSPNKLNLYFPNSIEKNFMILELKNNNVVNFFIEKEEDNLFVLKVDLNLNDEILEISSFNNEKEANQALMDVKTAVYSPNKLGVKIIGFIFMIVFLLMLISDLIGRNNTYPLNSKEESSKSLPNMIVPPQAIGTPMSPEEIKKTIEETQQEIMKQVELGKQSIIDDNKRVQERLQKEVEDSQKSNPGADPTDVWLNKMK